jgi:alpha-tubulin suppressor-like RCC1 family protein
MTSIYSWGSGSLGCLGLKDYDDYSTPQLVDVGSQGHHALDLLATSGCHSFLSFDGVALSSGDNSEGQLGRSVEGLSSKLSSESTPKSHYFARELTLDRINFPTIAMVMMTLSMIDD